MQSTVTIGRSHISGLQSHSCYKIFESRSGFVIFSNLRIPLLFVLRKPSVQPNICSVSNEEMTFTMTTQTPAENTVTPGLAFRKFLTE